MKKTLILIIATVGYLSWLQLFASQTLPVPRAQAESRLINPHLGTICKATAAISFGRNFRIMQLDKVDEQGVAWVHYLRPSDHSRWAIRCRLQEDRVIWMADNPDSDARWRIGPDDEKITWRISEDNLTLRLVYPDGSGDEQTFQLE
ncbi:hypothetical protein L579_3063 [Pantoea sp. AS-PWVM4]|uniref:hypothetical protein n=1 Tax=Pantoea sp. AS-PWVM4 TaxID=1332069 RepID=UPI0003AC7A06|nr:hypothetical protein [Pantoea sp. AS-PWVM4]ERK18108.1 hypothetical protein L579_3063 [Pantoea sp. AS-PWVM4]